MVSKLYAFSRNHTQFEILIFSWATNMQYETLSPVLKLLISHPNRRVNNQYTYTTIVSFTFSTSNQ